MNAMRTSGLRKFGPMLVFFGIVILAVLLLSPEMKTQIIKYMAF